MISCPQITQQALSTEDLSHLSTAVSMVMSDERGMDTRLYLFQRSLPIGVLSVFSLSGIRPELVLEIGRCTHWLSHSGVCGLCWEWSLKNTLEFNIAAPRALPQTKTNLPSPLRFEFSPIFNLVLSLLHPFSRIQK